MRRAASIFALALVVGACAPTREGPVAPIAREQLVASTALDASAARQAVLEFVHAYAASPTDGAGALARLVSGPELTSWVRWLDVQHGEFNGAIQAATAVRDVEFVGSLEGGRATGAQVGLSATVTFSFAPVGDAAFDRARILDGPVTLVRADSGRYHVLDLLRDGVPMSDGIQLFPDESRTEGLVDVTLDSLFMFPPNWQFNVLIRNRGPETIVLDPEVVGLYVEEDGAFERLDGVVTRSLATVPPGATVAGILAYPMQETGRGRVLTVGYRLGRDDLLFEFPLEGLVSVVPPAPAPVESQDGDVTA